MLAQRPHILGHQPGEDAVKLAVFTGPNVPHTQQVKLQKVSETKCHKTVSLLIMH